MTVAVHHTIVMAGWRGMRGTMQPRTWRCFAGVRNQVGGEGNAGSKMMQRQEPKTTEHSPHRAPRLEISPPS